MVMAASRHQCTYLMEIYGNEFLGLEGDPEWLEGPAKLPPKLRRLLRLNALLAHQPWLLAMDDVADLVRSGHEGWSILELVHAVALMAHCHQLCSFVLGCGVAPEPDSQAMVAEEDAAAAAAAEAAEAAAAAPPREEAGAAAPEPVAEGEGEGSSIEDIIAQLKRRMGLTEEEEDTEETNLANFDAADDATVDAKSPQQQQAAAAAAAAAVPGSFVWQENEGDEEGDEGEGGGGEAGGAGEDGTAPGARRPPILGHVDFDVRSKVFSVFRTQIFSWEDHGYATMSRYLPELADLLEAKFVTTKNLTYEFIGDEQGVDTFKFRWAVWNYVLRIKGIVRDEYMYRDVNALPKCPPPPAPAHPVAHSPATGDRSRASSRR